jgi:NTE family protein
MHRRGRQHFASASSTRGCFVRLCALDPIERCEVSRSAAKILNRINEMWFNSSPMRELRAISFVRRLIDNSKIREGMLRKILSHSNFAGHVVARLGGASKPSVSWQVLEGLHDLGSKSVDA